jgi:hypothetical protein
VSPINWIGKSFVRGVNNNQPHMIAEWKNMTANERKRALRMAFGHDDGDRRLRNLQAIACETRIDFLWAKSFHEQAGIAAN